MFRDRIRRHERGLVFRDGDFVRLLGPGWYWTLGLRLRRRVVERFSTLDVRFEHDLIDVLVADARLRDALHVLDLDDNQRALVWQDGRLREIVGPGRHAFWRTPYELRFEVFNIDEPRFTHAKLDAVLGLPGGNRWFEVALVPTEHRALLKRDGRLVEVLDPGRYVFWRRAEKLQVEHVDLREQLCDVSGQDIMTRDKVTLRVNLLVTYRVRDAARAVTSTGDYGATLYREAQLALRAAVGGRTLEELLTGKETVGDELRVALGQRAGTFGAEIIGVGLRDLILPGEMKQILNQVILAEKQAQANLIRRREETAAARSQANTAKLLAENPTLARIKELEALQEILAGARATFVFGQGELTDQIRSLIGKGPD